MSVHSKTGPTSHNCFVIAVCPKQTSGPPGCTYDGRLLTQMSSAWSGQHTQGLDIVFARAGKGWHARVRVPPCQTEAAVAAKGIKWATGSIEVAPLWDTNLQAGALVGLSLVVLHSLGVARLVSLQAAQLTQETQAKRLACNHASTS